MAMPIGISITKSIVLVNALAKVNNFCISEADGNSIDVPVEDLFMRMWSILRVLRVVLFNWFIMLMQ